jgi:hypothetical protein
MRGNPDDLSSNRLVFAVLSGICCKRIVHRKVCSSGESADRIDVSQEGVSKTAHCFRSLAISFEDFEGGE